MGDVAAAGEEAGPTREWRAIPPLRGRVLAAYTGFWWLALAIAIAAIGFGAYSQYGKSMRPVFSPLGIDMHSNDGFLQISAVHSDEARRSGVRFGDEVLAIDGREVPRGLYADVSIRPLLTKSEGETVRLTLRGANEASREVVLTRRQAHVAEKLAGTGVSHETVTWVAILTNVAVAALFVVAAIFLYPIRRAPVAALLGAAFLCIAMTHRGDLWDVAGLMVLSDSINLLGWTGMIATMLIFPDGRFPSRFAVGVALFCVASLPITGPNPFGQTVTNLIFALQFVLVAAVMARRYRSIRAGSEKQQMRWAFFGFAIGVLILMCAIATLTFYSSPASATPWRQAWLPIIATTLFVLAIASMVGGLLVSVLRFRLYDADAVIGRSAAIGVLTLGFVALFAASEKVVEIVGERYFADSIGVGAGIIGAAMAAVLIVPLHNRVHIWAERRFQKGLIRLRQGLPQCVDDLRETATVERLAAAVTSRVEAGVRSSRAAVVIGEGSHALIAGLRGVGADAVQQWRGGWTGAAGGPLIEIDGADPLFPTRVELRVDSGDAPETIGWLLLGPRPDGSLFGKDEREALADIAERVARALHIARIREQRERDAERRMSRIERMIEEVAGGLRSPGMGTLTA
ncbi:hypothetical protein H9L13_05570 [Sphingomonas lutea]|uniref:PDZ domain-containing protein n=1 Tax=Sphingomonas lutea TaxID=1045317 RepID=A0A7G9SKF7_9SPHN|nr:hypothetical protein [Sphingomonas lutea]QNN68332.1 hypothetical protein H9L13_05570 [Sphingomonas lutea]